MYLQCLVLGDVWLCYHQSFPLCASIKWILLNWDNMSLSLPVPYAWNALIHRLYHLRVMWPGISHFPVCLTFLIKMWFGPFPAPKFLILNFSMKKLVTVELQSHGNSPTLYSQLPFQPQADLNLRFLSHKKSSCCVSVQMSCAASWQPHCMLPQLCAVLSVVPEARVCVLTPFSLISQEALFAGKRWK